MLAIFLAIAIDLMIGHPQWRFHPVRLIGRVIEGLERRLFPAPRQAASMLLCRSLGLVLLLGTLTVVLSVGYVIMWTSRSLGGDAGEFVASVLIIYFCVALKDLGREATTISRLIENADIVEARARLRSLVSRDPSTLDEVAIRRASIESVAENFTDSFVAAVFYAVLFGPLGALFYRTVNTLDAMIGYRSERYRGFGWASARFDDVLNFIPARLTGACLYVIGAFRTCARRNGHPSPNAWIPEAYFAQLLKVRLGGEHPGFETRSMRPEYGPPQPATAEKVNAAVKLVYLAMSVSLVPLTVLWFIKARLIP